MQNRISTNTNLICFNRDKSLKMTEIVPLLQGYYQKLDLNFCEMLNPQSSLLNEFSAKPYIETLLKYKKMYLLDYHQAHLPYVKDFRSLSREGRKIHFAMLEKALSYCKILGIKTAVMHPIKGNLDDNIEYFEYIESFLPSDISIAIENLERVDEIYSAEDLIRLIRKLPQERFSACLDVGHAFLMEEDIPLFIKTLGRDLIATHISDNNGKNDDHLLPGFGKICWEKVIPVFKDYYGGYLNYEAMFFGKNLPSSFIEERINLSVDIASWLLSL